MSIFRFSFMDYEVDPVLDNLLNKSLNSGIKSVTNGYSINIIIHFNDGSKINARVGADPLKTFRYQGWLNEGTYTYPDGSVFNWSRARAKRKTFRRLFKQLNTF